MIIQKATEELHRCFGLFNDHFFDGELTTPAITIQTNGKRSAYGWCSTVPFWNGKAGDEGKFEVNMSAEHLDRDVYEIMRTLLHEMVHLYNTHIGVQDCSRGNTYHNKKFKEASEKYGFYYDAPADKKYGWCFSKLTEETMRVIDTFNVNAEAFNYHRYRTSEALSKGKGKGGDDEDGDGESESDGGSKKSSSVKLVCPKCAMKLRATKKGLLVICKTCEEELIEI